MANPFMKNFLKAKLRSYFLDLPRSTKKSCECYPLTFTAEKDLTKEEIEEVAKECGLTVIHDVKDAQPDADITYVMIEFDERQRRVG